MASEDTSCSDVLWPSELEDLRRSFLQVPSSQGHATSQILLSEPVVPPGGVRLAGTATGVRFRDGFLRLLPCLYSLE